MRSNALANFDGLEKVIVLEDGMLIEHDRLKGQVTIRYRQTVVGHTTVCVVRRVML